MSEKIVRIGGAGGFRFDSLTAVPQFLRAGNIDYLIFDSLAEGSMGALGQAAAQNPAAGFSADFVHVYLQPHLAKIMAQGVKVIANAGGLNPEACADLIAQVSKELGVSPRVATVAGDDLRSRAGEFRRAGYRDMFSGAPFPPGKIASINAYLGAFPIAAALRKGADIVITGRGVDSALVLGPLIHEFGWTFRDYDLLAAGTTVGHLLECGAQVTGGTFTDWREVPDWAHIGYPIAECRADGTAIITKPAETGGLVSAGTVAEQLLYEVSDPACYFVPDVTADFSQINLKEVGPHRVLVSGAHGRPPTATYKVCLIYEDGWRAAVLQPIMGMDAVAKADYQASSLIARTRDMLRSQNLGDWKKTHIEVLGSEATYGAHGRMSASREVICRIVVDHNEKRAVELFALEQISTITSMSVGTSIGLGTAVTPIQNLFSFLLPKDQVTASIRCDGVTESVPVPADGGYATPAPTSPSPPESITEADMVSVPLIELAVGRSGDKGDLFNVAVIARRPEYLPFIRAALTTGSVSTWFTHVSAQLGAPRVDRHEAPGIHALNFVIHNALDGGITSSPRVDKVAKTMAQQLLEFPIPIPRVLTRAMRRPSTL